MRYDTPMTRHTVIALLMVLAVFGFADSFYLAESALTDTTLICDIEGLDGCNEVAQSPYSKPFGIPLGVFGLGFYGVSFVLLVALWVQPRRLFHHLFIALSLVGTVASIGFMALQFFVIEAMCIYCIISAVITFLMLPLSILLFRRFTPQFPVVVP